MTQQEITDLEKVILGSLIQKQSLIDSHIMEKHITAFLFSDPRNQLVFSEILVMHYQGIAISQVSLVQFLITQNMLEKAGGALYIAELDSDGFPGNIDFYLERLANLYLKNQTIQLLRKSTETLLQLNEVTNEDLNKIITDFSQLSEIGETTKIFSMPELYETAKKEILENINSSKPTGILSGFTVFDSVTDGFQKGELAILAARPSIGKTSLALSMCMNIANSTPCAFISLETPATMIAYKITGLVTDTSIFQLRKGFLNEQKQNEIFNLKANDFNKNFFLVDKTRVEIMELKSIIRRLVLQMKCEIVFIDYIGLIDAGSQNMPVYEKQSIVSRILKETAREFDIAICALCQVARGTEAQGKPPLLSDLRGSGSIEQDADVVMFIHGQRIIPKDQQTTERELIIAKNRNGECTLGKINFIKATAKYTNLGGQ